jgi:hypothetical protein
VLPAFGRRIDAMFAQYIRDRPAANVMPQVRQRALNSRIAPRSILQGHANDELDDHLDRSGPTGSTAVGVRPFLCDQRSIPPHQRIRRDRRVELTLCASRLTAGRKLVKSSPFRSRALRGLNVKPRKVNCMTG